MTSHLLLRFFDLSCTSSDFLSELPELSKALAMAWVNDLERIFAPVTVLPSASSSEPLESYMLRLAACGNELL